MLTCAKLNFLTVITDSLRRLSYPAVFVSVIFCFLPYHGTDRSVVSGYSHGSALKRHYFAGIIGELLGGDPRNALGLDRGIGDPCIKKFPVPYVRKEDRSRYSGKKVLSAGDKLFPAVLICQLDLGTQCRRLEAVIAKGYPTCPPPGGYTRGETVFAFFLKVRHDIVFVLENTVVIVRPKRSKLVIFTIAAPDSLAVHNCLEYPERGYPQFCRANTVRQAESLHHGKYSLLRLKIKLAIVVDSLRGLPRVLAGLALKSGTGYENTFFHRLSPYIN